MQRIDVFINSTQNISKDKYEAYIKKFDMESEVYPDFDPQSHTGYLPFKIKVNKDFVKGKELLSGFEYISMPYDFEQVKQEAQEERKKKAITKKTTGLRALFGGKKQVEESISDVYISKKVDEKLSKCQNRILIDFGSFELFEQRMVLSFVSYLVETCNGIMLDYYSGDWHSDNISNRLLNEINQYEKKYNLPNRKIYEFEGWD